MSKKTFEEVTRQRDSLYQVLQERRALGGFDAHAETIVTILQSQVAVLNHLISLEEKK